MNKYYYENGAGRYPMDARNPYSNMEESPNCSYCPPGYAPPAINKPVTPYQVAVPIELAKSLEGKYFVGYADNLTYGLNQGAWARLYNPPRSGVNLHVTVWTVTGVSDNPYRAQIWFNATPLGTPQDSDLVTTSNYALCPLPQNKVRLQYASNVTGDPTGGIKAFARRGQPQETMADDEEGKFIFPPSGSFLITISSPEVPTQAGVGRIAFGWWEEPIY